MKKELAGSISKNKCIHHFIIDHHTNNEDLKTFTRPIYAHQNDQQSSNVERVSPIAHANKPNNQTVEAKGFGNAKIKQILMHSIDTDVGDSPKGK